MKNVSLSSLLLIALATPFIMTYRISPGETPYWLFGLIFFGFFLRIFINIVSIKEKTKLIAIEIIFWLVALTILGSGFISSIIVRHQVAPVYMVHDIILQQEAAIRFLLDGKNPYSTTYFGTALEQWHYSDKDVNPALFHFVMQPFYLLFALPFYFFSNTFLGYFDARIPLFFLFFFMLVMAALLVKEQEKRHVFVTLLAFNPATLPYLLEGRSDIFMFSFLFMGLFLLHYKRYFLAGIPLALSFAVKQSAWVLFPFYLAYLFCNLKRLNKVAKTLVPFFSTLVLIVGPFLLWDANAFLSSTLYYLSGSIPNSYPISGYGFGMLLHQFEFISDLKSYYPFEIWQLAFGIPLMVILIRYLKKSADVGRMILVYGLLLFVYWYFSRYFHNSHLGYLSMVFVTSYFWPKEENKI